MSLLQTEENNTTHNALK